MCSCEPLLWLIFSHLISDALAAKIGYQATVDLLNIFADDVLSLLRRIPNST